MPPKLDIAHHSDGLVTLGAPVTHWAVTATQSVSYEIRIVDGLFTDGNRALLEDVGPRESRPRRLVVTDQVVDRLYGHRIRQYLRDNGVEHRVCVLPDGESAKTMDTALHIIDALDDFGVDRRREPVIAIGGGVLLDMVGFACGMYRRATPWIRVPTTLIGLVDAGVGVKTGLNNNGHKNRLGSYFAADRTLLDRTFLQTLDLRHVSNGMAEILKIALVKDARLFELLKNHGPELVGGRLQPPAGPGGRTTKMEVKIPGGDHDPATEVLERSIQSQ